MKLARLVLCWVWLGAVAGNAAAGSTRDTAEASMLVTGMVEVNPDGTLHGYTIDQSDKVPPEVMGVIGRSIPHWGFKFSRPVTDVVKTKMNIRMVARKAADGKFYVSVAGTSFGEEGQGADDKVQYKTREPAPKYPRVAIDARVTGTAYLLLRIGRDGTVEEAIAEQVNLGQYGTESEMKRLRNALAGASLEAARQWKYALPTHGPGTADPYWVVRVPVQFNLYQMGEVPKPRPYGSWDVYIPGPRESAPWVTKALLAESPDAVPDGELHTGNALLQLATPPGGV